MKGRGVVTSNEGNRAKVSVTTSTECMGCPSKSHCHSDTLNSREIVVINELGARVSDHVVFEADPGKVLISGVLIWIVPILAMIVGYKAAQQFSAGFIPIGAAFLFLLLTFVMLKFVDQKLSGGRTFYPRIIRIVDASSSGENFCDDR